MAKKDKAVQGITLEELEKMLISAAKAKGNRLTQDDLDAFQSRYDLDDEAYENLIDAINENHIEIEDGLDALEIDDDDFMAGGADDLDDLEDRRSNRFCILWEVRDFCRQQRELHPH